MVVRVVRYVCEALECKGIYWLSRLLATLKDLGDECDHERELDIPQ